jgi:hypothetical protein
MSKSIKKIIWIIGAGDIGKEYANILNELNYNFKVIGRGKKSSQAFKSKTNIDVLSGGLVKVIQNTKNLPTEAIVAVGINELYATTVTLLNNGFKKILVEKPGSLKIDEIKKLNILSKKKGSNVFIAYNRRFYNSVNFLRKKIKTEKILSVSFDFTELSKRINSLSIKNNIKKKWLIANSSHVIDLVFNLCGLPKFLRNYSIDSLKWHPSSAIFCGYGLTKKNIVFNYHSNWLSPGRWGIEIMTKKNKYVLRPIEVLQVMKENSFDVKSLVNMSENDKKFKPGFLLQTKYFLSSKQNSILCDLDHHLKLMKILYKIAGYNE